MFSPLRALHQWRKHSFLFTERSPYRALYHVLISVYFFQNEWTMVIDDSPASQFTSDKDNQMMWCNWSWRTALLIMTDVCVNLIIISTNLIWLCLPCTFIYKSKKRKQSRWLMVFIETSSLSDTVLHSPCWLNPNQHLHLLHFARFALCSTVQ